MPRHSRRHHKGSRKAHRKSHRKAHRKGSRKAHRKSHRKSQRGGSCAAMPLNREVFAQRGGMAPYSTGDATLLDKATMIQAQSWPQADAIAEAQNLARAAQHGGARRRRATRRRGRRAQRGGSYPWAPGLQGFDQPYTLVSSGTPTGTNPQFQTEGSVNSLYSEARGAQY